MFLSSKYNYYNLKKISNVGLPGRHFSESVPNSYTTFNTACMKKMCTRKGLARFKMFLIHINIVW